MQYFRAFVQVWFESLFPNNFLLGARPYAIREAEDPILFRQIEQLIKVKRLVILPGPFANLVRRIWARLYLKTNYAMFVRVLRYMGQDIDIPMIEKEDLVFVGDGANGDSRMIVYSYFIGVLISYFSGWRKVVHV